jgi:hypothetical protein
MNLNKRIGKLLTCAAGMLLSGTAMAQAAIPFPIDVNQGGPGMVALWDLIDATNDPTGTKIHSVHSLPNQVVPAFDPESGVHDFHFRPNYDDFGDLNELILDFSLMTSTSANVPSALEAKYGPIRFFYPMAKTSLFTPVKSNAGIQILTAADGEPSADPSARSMMTVQGISEPIRIVLNKKGLNNFSCALDVLQRVRSQAEQKSIPAPEANALSILTGRVVQTYRVFSSERLGQGERVATDYTHYLPVKLNGEDVNDQSLPQKIFQTTKFFYPTCRVDSNLPIQKQIEFNGFQELVDFASKHGLALM